MKNAIVRLGFCLLFVVAGYSAHAGVPGVTVTGPALNNSGTILFDIQFTEDVTGFLLTDVTLTGAASAGIGAPVFSTIDAKHYTVSVPGVTTNGQLTLTVPAAVAQSVSTTQDNTSGAFTAVFDNVKPGLTVDKNDSPAQDDPTNSTPVVFKFVFSEPINPSTFTSSDIKFTGSTATTLSVNAATGIVETGAMDKTTYLVKVDIAAPFANGTVVVTVNAGDVSDPAGNTSNAQTNTDNSVQFNGIKPTVTTAAASNIDDKSADVGGTITSNGSSAITEHGVYWSTSPGVTTASTKFQIAGTSSPFSGNLASLSAQTRIYYRAYAINGAGTSLSATEADFYTLSLPPNGTSAVPTPGVTITGPNDATITFPAANTQTNAKGYVILRRKGAEPPTTDLPDGIHPTLLAANGLPASSDSHLVGYVDDNATSIPDTGLDPCEHYYWVAVLYNWDGSNNVTTNYRVGGPSFNDNDDFTWCSSSDIQNLSTTAQLDYATKQLNTISAAGDGMLVYSLRLRDGGGSADNDTKKTELASLKISISNPTALRKVALITAGGTVIEKTPGATVDFAIPDNTIIASDGGSSDFGIYVTFQNTAALIQDQANIDFAVMQATTRVGTNGGGSDLVSSTGNATSVAHKINVIATKLEFSNVSALINPGSNFSLTISALDGNDLVDVNPANVVTLSQTAGTGALSSTDAGGGLVQPLVNGTFTWNALKFSTASTAGNLKTIKADQTSGSPSIPDAFLTNITVTSLGTKIFVYDPVGATPDPNSSASVIPQSFCFNSTSTAPATYSTLYSILIAESDGADFDIGNDLTFTLMLPAGFIFDTRIVPTLTATGPDIAASATAMTVDVPGVPGNSYIGNNIVRVRYKITGTTGKDYFTITGLKVKYTSTTPVTNQPITRVGGSAVQEKNSDSENPPVAHGKLSATDGSTIATFRNQTPVDADKVSFGRNDAPIILEGLADTGGGPVVVSGSSVFFEGDGVVYNGTQYRFNPSTVADGTHDITFTYTDSGTGCKSTSTKTYSVFSSLINGLATSYCRNGASTPLGTPTTAAPGGQCTITPPLPSLPYQIAAYSASNYKYTYYDPYLGAFGGEVDLPDQANFDPKHPSFQAPIDYFGGYLIVYAYYVNNCTGGLYYLGGIAIRIYDPPQLQITNDFQYGVCSTEPVKELKANLFLDNSYDEFWATANGGSATLPGVVTGDRTNGFFLNPDDANPGSSDLKIDIHYRHKETGANATQCASEVVTTIDVWGKPVPVALNLVSIRGASNDASAEFCLEEDLTPWSVTHNDNIDYKWHYDNDSKPPLEGDEFPISKNDFAPYQANAVANYQLTQILHRVWETRFNIITGTFVRTRLLYAGCEGDDLDLTVKIMEPTKVTMDKSGKTCEGVPLTLSTLHPNITSPIPNVDGTWTSTGTGVFKDINGNVDNTYLNAVTYHPTNADYANTKFTLRLDSEPQAGPCTSDFKEVDISVTPGITITYPSPQFDRCASPSIPVSVTVTGASFTWSDTGAGEIDPAYLTKPDAFFIPTQAQYDAGATVTLNVTTDDPDGSGPCLSVTEPVTLKIHQRPLISTVPDFSVCTDAQHDITQSMSFNLTATKDPLKSSAANWSWAITSTGSTTPGTIDDPTSLVTHYTPSSVMGDITTDNPVRVASSFIRPIQFTITASAPVGNVCDVEKSTVTVTIKGTPQTPTPTIPAPYCLGQSIDFLTTEVPLPQWYNNIAAGSVSTSKSIAPAVTPNVEAVSKYWLTQTFDGCESDFAPIVIVVNPVPVSNFDFSKICLGDVTEFSTTSSISAPIPDNPVQTRSIVSWEYVFDDGTQTTPGSGTIPVGAFKGTSGTFENPLHSFENVGSYNVTLNVKTSDGCSGTKTKLVKVGAIPKPEFTVSMLCEGDETQFTSSSSLPTDEETTATYTWDFDGTPDATRNPQIEFASVGTYDVSLKIKTLLECEKEITKQVSIFPYVKSFPYIENFEGNHGWVPEGRVFDGSSSTENTSWSLLTAAGSITSDPALPAGSHFWATHTNAGPNNFYYENERSVLYGPCVDMKSLSRPVLALDYFSDTELQGDGAYIEYREEDENGDGAWKRLGDNTGGLEWYNGASISGLSQLGGSDGVGQALSQYGWTGATDGWRTGRYNLDAFAEMDRVRFRIVFGSNQSVTTDTYDGFAIDYFKLESRNRLVLVENFTSNSASTTITNNAAAFHSFPATGASGEVVKIEYHTGLPAATGDPKDPIYTQNPMDPNARASFYGLSAVPRAYIDGFSDATHGGKFGINVDNNRTWTDDYYNTESLKTSPIEIVIDDPEVTDGVLNVTGSVKALDTDLLSNKYSLYIAVVERWVSPTNTFVLRKMLPSASGSKVPATSQGQSFTFAQSWRIDKEYLAGGDTAQLIAIAFVQSDIASINGERQVLQAAYHNITDLRFTTGVEIPFLEQTAMYPNPADKTVNIELPEPTASGVEVNILDQLGRTVARSFIGAGQKAVSVSTVDLASTVYIVQLKENGVNTARKLVITHSHH